MVSHDWISEKACSAKFFHSGSSVVWRKSALSGQSWHVRFSEEKIFHYFAAKAPRGFSERTVVLFHARMSKYADFFEFRCFCQWAVITSHSSRKPHE